MSGVSNLYLLPGQALYAGAGQDSGLHRHHAVQIGVSFDAPLRVRGSDEEAFREVAGFVAAPNATHQVLSEGRACAFVWSEIARARLGFSWRALEGAELEGLRGLLQPNSLEANAIGPTIRRALATVGVNPREVAPDARVRAALERLRQPEALSSEAALEDLARDLGLSASRLRHLFKAQAGLSLKRYALWQKVFRALELAALGNLTEAALEAGFSDSSHFSRVFRESFGLAPSGVFGSRSVQVRLCRDDLDSGA